VASLDFDDIRNNLATFLNAQPDMADVDFQSPASAANMILNILATATAYNGIYAQMAYVNSWPSSANISNSILGCASLSSVLIPYKQSAKSTVTMTVSGSNTGGIPAYTAFKAIGTNGSNLFFYNIDDIPYQEATSVDLYSGGLVYTFTNFDYVTKSMTLPKEIDPATIRLYVTIGLTEYEWTRVEKGKDISGVDNRFYCVTHSTDGYRVVTDMPGTLDITTSARVAVTAIYSNGAVGNNATIQFPPEVTATFITSPSGGYDELTIEQLKAKFNFNSNGYKRCVTLSDYKNAIVASGIAGTSDPTLVTVSNGSVPATVNVYVDGLSSSNQTLLLNYLTSLSVAGISINYTL
jgi:hypothetical protein